MPEVFNNQFSFVTGTTRSSSRNDLIVKRTKKEIGKRSSSIIGAVIWNSIPNEIRELQFKGFCKAYKSLLITAYTWKLRNLYWLLYRCWLDHLLNTISIHENNISLFNYHLSLLFIFCCLYVFLFLFFSLFIVLP